MKNYTCIFSSSLFTAIYSDAVNTKKCRGVKFELDEHNTHKGCAASSGAAQLHSFAVLFTESDNAVIVMSCQN